MRNPGAVARKVFIKAVILAALLVAAPVSSAVAQTAPDLGTAEDFGVLGGAAVTNTGPTTVSANVGVSPGTSITGFPPGIVLPPGTFHSADAVAAQAQADALIAYNDLASQPCPTENNLTGVNLDGLTLTPGVYCFDSSADLAVNGTLTLDAQGDPNAVFIFQMGSTLTTGSNSTIRMINGGQNCNVFWQVGSSATLGTNSVFLGNILAVAAITATTGADIFGRLLARVEAVTLDTNVIDAAFCAVAAQQADLEVEKSVDDANPAQGDTLTFTVEATNLGPADATGVQITDALPTGLTFVSSNVGADYDDTTGIWDVGSLQVGETATLTLEAIYEPQPGETLVNTASVSALDQEDSNSTNDQGSVVVYPPDEEDLTDLAIDKNVNLATAPQGSLVTFDVTVRNRGPDTATGVVVNDTTTAGLLFVSSTQTHGSYDSATDAWTIGELASEEEAVLTLTFQVVGTGTQSNSSTVSGNELDLDQSNNEDSASLEVDEVDSTADLELIKSVDDAEPGLGDTIVYTLSLTNDGPRDATGVEVYDGLPTEVDYVSDNSSSTGTTYDPATGIWTVGSLDSGQTVELEITATVVDDAQQIINTARITAAQQVDSDLTNNQSTVVLNPVEAVSDLSVQKTVDQPAPQAGEEVLFTITTRNNGPNDATGVQILDQLPSGLDYIDDTASQGTYDSTSGIWLVGDLAAGQTATLQIRASVLDDSQPIINTASVEQSDQPDLDETNNESTLILLPVEAVVDLSIQKSVDSAEAKCGDTVVFTVTVRNASLLFGANNVVVNEMLVPEFGYISSTATRGSYNSDTGEWSIPTLGTGEIAVLTIEAEILCSP